MRSKISAETVIAATIASLRHSKDNAYVIAKTVIRDLHHFGYDIRRLPDSENIMSETIEQKTE